MDSKKFEILMTAVDLGSFSKAAEALSYTPSGVNQLVSALEKEFGFPLFRRNTKGVSLTLKCCMFSIISTYSFSIRLTNGPRQSRHDVSHLLCLKKFALKILRKIPHLATLLKGGHFVHEVAALQTDNAVG